MCKSRAITKRVGLGGRWCTILVAASALVHVVHAEIIPESRRVEWRPGVQGGIPFRDTIFCDVTQAIPGTNIVAVGDGVADDTAALHAAIQLCPSNQVVFLPEGTYRVTDTFFFATKSHFTLRGQGPDRTVILADFTEPKRLFRIGQGRWNPLPAEVRTILSGYEKGSNRVVLDNVANIGPGRVLLFDQLNDETDLVTSTGSGGLCTFSDRPHDGTRNLSQIVRVEQVDGNEVTFWPPFTWTYSAERLPEAVLQIPSSRRVGFEDLQVTSATNTVTDFFNFYNVDECWLRNVESYKVRNNHVFMHYTLGCEIRDSFFHDGYQHTVGQSYGIIARQSTALLVENNILHRLNAPLIVYGGATGCVVGYNYVRHAFTDVGSVQKVGLNAGHGAHGIMNLFEGNVSVGFQSDWYWGSVSHITLFRNRFTGRDEPGGNLKRTISIDRFCLYHNVVGNVLGRDDLDWLYSNETSNYPNTLNVIYRLGFPSMGNNRFYPDAEYDRDLRVEETLLRHGNFDYATGTTIWDDEIESQALPDSLYLDGPPPWWGGAAWPAIGPDREPMASKIPAQLRFEGQIDRRLAPPSDLIMEN